MRIDFIRDFTFLTSLILLLQFSVILQTSHLYVYLPQTLCKMSVLLPEIELDNSRRLRISAQMVDTGEKMTPKNRFLSFCPGFVFPFKAWSTSGNIQMMGSRAENIDRLIDRKPRSRTFSQSQTVSSIEPSI